MKKKRKIRASFPLNTLNAKLTVARMKSETLIRIRMIEVHFCLHDYSAYTAHDTQASVVYPSLAG